MAKRKGDNPIPTGEQTDEIREFLVGMRKAMGMTQQELGVKMGITRDAVWELERSIGNISVYRLERWTRGLGLHMEIKLKFLPYADAAGDE